MADMAGQDADEFDVARFSAFRELCGKLAKPTGPFQYSIRDAQGVNVPLDKVEFLLSILY